ncbi:hypothetical protein ACFX13_003463 [Malus domestica]|uniref:Tubulin alpha-6 chain n=1 Tax=Malus domestica TaxID=3750 RepID=A0A498J0R2_MALDO|nr:uncharacterized protein LOC114827607 [Malus domestica]XP_050107884.1 uncharacterized protein LOC126586967 [Malus sylvestris]RXH87532.1 hypothetical protein DVH24_034432 [Malus domestica]
MASIQMLKSPLSSIPVSQSNFPGKSSRVFSENQSRKCLIRLSGYRGSGYLLRDRRRFGVCCKAQESDSKSNGEEPPESLFMKELRRRGMNPTSLLEERERTEYGMNDEMRNEDRGFSARNAVSTEIEKSLANQRERSMQLNSEGLEGLIPRARLLLTIGGTFFLGFWPLILITVALFSALYLYFGSTFVHDGSSSQISPLQYIDPYELLEDERISQIAPRVK